MLLKEICSPNVVCCGAQTSVLEAARLMRQKHVGDVVVVDDPHEEGIPLGIVTDRDLVLEVLGDGLDPSTTPLGSLMRTPVVIAHESEDTAQVLERMRAHGVRRIPVVAHEGETVGIITLDDLLRLFVADASALLAIMMQGRTNEQH